MAMVKMVPKCYLKSILIDKNICNIGFVLLATALLLEPGMKHSSDGRQELLKT